jgi:predicted O-linked N-acetylglucosamine transferase (SPINDLY family)
MATLSEALQIGLLHHRAGRLDLAEQIYRRILAVEPEHADALHLLGLVAHQTGQHAKAAELIGRAVATSPGVSVYYGNLGEAQRVLRRTTEAIAAYRRAIELDPRYAEAHTGLGLVLQELGQFDDALACHRRALEIVPDYAEAHNNLGIVLQQRGRLAEAAACYERAVQLKPDLAAAHINLGVVLQRQGMLEKAAICYRRGLTLESESAEGFANLGVALAELGQLDEAIACQQRALHANPQFAKAHLNLGNALKDRGDLGEAVVCYRRALELEPGYVEAHSNLLYTMHYTPEYDARAICDEHRRWNSQHAAPLARDHRPHENDATPDRRLRVGYVSPDFRAHPLAHIAGPLFAHHDHRAFEVFFYSDVPRPDDVTARLRRQADGWREVFGRTDAEVAEQIRADRIDILVDLALHMAYHRLLVFARKPAPVQVSWFAYPSTSGLSAIDYRLTDPYLDPPGAVEDAYVEQSIRLPDCFWCYDPQTEDPPVGPLPAESGGGVTFGSLNNFCKINPAVIRLWAEVLRAVANSRLLVLAKTGSHRERFLRAMEQAGVAPDRVEFAGLRSRAEYLQLYQRIDVGLDTFPYNGHTTTLDALWVGVPIVSLAGGTAVHRAGRSLLSNLGRPHWAVDTPEQYVKTAVELCADIPRLAAIRGALREELRRSPLMDGRRFARGMEAAYRDMWHRWCAR